MPKRFRRASARVGLWAAVFAMAAFASSSAWFNGKGVWGGISERSSCDTNAKVLGIYTNTNLVELINLLTAVMNGCGTLEDGSEPSRAVLQMSVWNDESSPDTMIEGAYKALHTSRSKQLRRALLNNRYVKITCTSQNIAIICT